MYIYPNLIFSLTEEPQKRALRIYLVLLKIPLKYYVLKCIIYKILFHASLEGKDFRAPSSSYK